MSPRTAIRLATFVLPVLMAAPALAQNTNGAGGDMPAYYDAIPLEINFKQLSDTAAARIIAQNSGLNFIYQSDQAVNAGFDFISVIDAIPTDGFNPLWEEVQIIFMPDVPFMQFFSDDEIAAALKAGLISLEYTGEVYRCSVLGP